MQPSRLARDIFALSQITDPGQPWTRRAFTPIFDQGREWLVGRMADAGLTVRIDAAGNLIGHRAGTDPNQRGALMIGSHSDTVPGGGLFDGIAGVLAGIEVAQALQDAGIALQHDLEIVDFLAEEVSIFGVSCIGSRGMTGQLPQDWLPRQAEGRSLAQALDHVRGHTFAAARPPDQIAAFLELHIEQGPVLENADQQIGIVTAIAGITRIEIVVDGRPDHAGTTPMDLRRDALVAAAPLVTAIREKALHLSSGPAHFTATVGEFSIQPGAANVVPERVRMLVDARATDRAQMDQFTDWLAQRAGGAGGTARIISDSMPSPCDPDLCDLLERAAGRLDLRHRRMVSGAGHDTAWIAKVAPAAMIFVPCRGGRSHCPEEWAEIDAIARGTELLFEAVLERDKAVEGVS